MTATPFEDLFPSMPRIDRAWEERKQRLMALTAEERIVAIRAGRLSYRELYYWSATRLDEVPRITTGDSAGGEFEWIAAMTPEIAEARDRPRKPVCQSHR